MTARPTPLARDDTVNLLRRVCADRFEINLRRLRDLVAIPSVSAAGADPAALVRSADAVADCFREIGVPEVGVITVDDSPPYVLAQWQELAGAPTLLLYAHHDVQPVGDPSAWSGDPFSPAVRGGRLYGRGAADDKAGILIHLAAIESWLLAVGVLPVNLTVLVEGEEEVGSKHLSRFLERYQAKVNAQFAVFADGMHWKTGVPTLTHSLRGVVSLIVTLRALERPVHSGYFGGPVPDPVLGMCVLLAKLADGRGVPVVGAAAQVAGMGERWSIPDGAEQMSAEENMFRTEAGMLPGAELIGPEGFDLTSKLWEAPTLTVIGMDVPRIHGASNTIQPSCRARISLRLPPASDPAAVAAAVTRHLRRHVPWGLECDISPVSLQPGWRGDPAGPLSSAAARAFSAAYDAPCAFVGLGGTIPFVSPFLEAAGRPDCVITGVGDPECAAHSPDESVSLADLQRACLGEALLIGELAGWRMSQETAATHGTDHEGDR